MVREQHPVWEVYDLHRTARLRIKYYCALLARARSINTSMEIFLAAMVSTSAVATLAVWTTGPGKTFWQILAAVSAVLAISKPFLRLPTAIQEAEEVVTGYRLIEQRLMRVESAIRNSRVYDESARNQFIATMEDLDAVVVKHPKTADNSKWIQKFEDEVNQELPRTSFFVPEI
jgi:hypothetical protein